MKMIGIRNQRLLRRMVGRCGLPLLLLLFGCAQSQGQMVVDGGMIEIHPKPEDSEAVGTFSFRNTSDRVIKIVKVETSCSCLSAVLDKKEYQPGETGQGTAEFKVASFVGRQEKTVSVTTDHPDQPVWEVPFVLVVPVVIELKPRTLQWWVGDPLDTKTCTVNMVGPDPMKITDVVSTRESVTFELKEVEPGRVYEIAVTPISTEKVLLGALKISTDSEIPKYQRQLAFFSVYRRPQEPVGKGKEP